MPAPTPPAQTPMTFLKGGAKDMFSAECAKLLAEAGYDAGWFGSYDHVAELNKNARKKVQILEVPGVLAGVWGLDDEHIFVWGSRVGGARDETILYRFDGSGFVEMPAPKGNVLGMGGARPDLIYAVGEKGLIARWDGSAWHAVPSPTQTVLSAVCVVNDDEMYAVGPGRRLLSGSVYGWTETLESATPMFGVAKFQDAVWVGASDTGLCKLAGDRLEIVKPNIKAERLEARRGLLVSSPAVIAGSDDGQAFKGVTVSKIVDIMTEPFAWKPAGP